MTRNEQVGSFLSYQCIHQTARFCYKSSKFEKDQNFVKNRKKQNTTDMHNQRED